MVYRYVIGGFLRLQASEEKLPHSAQGPINGGGMQAGETLGEPVFSERSRKHRGATEKYI